MSEIKEYAELMKSVANFASSIGLNTEDFYRCVHVPSEDKWVISVSHKDYIGDKHILYSHKDTLKPDFDKRLLFPVFVGSREEINHHRKIAEDNDADIFIRKNIACEFVQPSPEFLALSKVEQVEYALHEAFHNTSKYFAGRKMPSLSRSLEEGSAFVAGHFGAVHYFKDTKLEKEAVRHCKKHIGLVRKFYKFYERLKGIYNYRLDFQDKPISTEQVMQKREDILKEAKIEFKEELGRPVNNAFFLYYNYFYEKVPVLLDERIREASDISQIVEILLLKR